MTREELLAIIEKAQRQRWKELDLSGKGISRLPPEIGQLSYLESLKLSEVYENNKITQVATYRQLML
jgi:internalin A